MASGRDRWGEKWYVRREHHFTHQMWIQESKPAIKILMMLYATCTMLAMDILAMCEQEDPGQFGVPGSQVVWW